MDVFKNFQGLIKPKEVTIDNGIFQMHYRFTGLLLFASGVMVASKQYFGDPIDCMTRDDIPNKIMDTYCWVHATFTLPGACGKVIGGEVPHPCVDKYISGNEDRTYHKYYQWVWFVLFFQACLFYAPHVLWKSLEGKLLKELTKELTSSINVARENKNLQDTAKYLARDNQKKHYWYFFGFVSCEILNLLNVIGQIYLVDSFLGGIFTTFGLDVLNYIRLDQEERYDPMVRVFPRMTKCSFHRYGASGDVQKHDALCILPLNIINEKIYVFMWFWFIFVAGISGLGLIYRLVTIFYEKERFRVIKRRAMHIKEIIYINYDLPKKDEDKGDKSQKAEDDRPRTLKLEVDPDEYFFKKLSLQEWFLHTMIAKNIDAHWYAVLIRTLIEILHRKDPETKKKIEKASKNRGKSRKESEVKVNPKKGSQDNDSVSIIIDGPGSDQYDSSDNDDDDSKGARSSLIERNNSRNFTQVQSKSRSGNRLDRK